MTLQSSGPISFLDLKTEFGDTNPVSLNEFYAGGSLVPPGAHGPNGNVPTSGALPINKFYGSSVIPGLNSGQFTMAMDSVGTTGLFATQLPVFVNGKYYIIGAAPGYGLYESTDAETWTKCTIITSDTGINYSSTNFIHRPIVLEQTGQLMLYASSARASRLILTGGTWTEPVLQEFALSSLYPGSSLVHYNGDNGNYYVFPHSAASASPYPVIKASGMWNNVFPVPTVSTLNAGPSTSGSNAYALSYPTIQFAPAKSANGNIWLLSASITGAGRMLYSGDGGTTFSMLTPSIGFTRSVLYAKLSGLFVAYFATTSGSTYWTSTNGTSWTARTIPFIPVDLAQSQAGAILGMATNTYLAGINVSWDGGLTWTQIPGPGSSYYYTHSTLAVINDRLFVGCFTSTTTTVANYRLLSVNAAS